MKAEAGSSDLLLMRGGGVNMPLSFFPATTEKGDTDALSLPGEGNSVRLVSSWPYCGAMDEGCSVFTGELKSAVGSPEAERLPPLRPFVGLLSWNIMGPLY